MPQAINPAFPLSPIGSLDELMAIAIAMEHEAAERYVQLAEAMDRRADVELAGLFRQLAELEREHEAGLGRWTRCEGQAVAPAPAIAWRMPETFGDEADAHSLTAYGALSIAVANEERAFTFYAYLAAQAEQPDIRRRAEVLAREELNHVHQLRRLRRRAFHAARPDTAASRRPRDALQLATLAQGLDATAAELDEAAARRLDAEGFAAAAIVLRSCRAAEPAGAAPLPAGAPTAEAALRVSLRHAEEMAEIYMATAEGAGDEVLLHDAQVLAERAVARLAVVRALLDQHQARR